MFLLNSRLDDNISHYFIHAEIRGTFGRHQTNPFNNSRIVSERFQKIKLTFLPNFLLGRYSKKRVGVNQPSAAGRLTQNPY